MYGYSFIYPKLTGMVIKLADKVGRSYNPKDDLFAAAEEALWLAKVPFTAEYSPLNYTIAYRAMLPIVKKQAKYDEFFPIDIDELNI